jgi:hypothetical protein
MDDGTGTERARWEEKDSSLAGTDNCIADPVYQSRFLIWQLD